MRKESDKFPARRVHLFNKPEKEIYFIQIQPPIGPVKIGISKSVCNRLATLQTANPYSLELLYSYPGTNEDEQDLMQYWKDYSMKGEWFHPVDGIFNFIDQCKYFDAKG